MSTQPHPAQIASHLAPEVWDKVNRLLVKKAISEYAHEWLLEPERLGPAEAPAAWPPMCPRNTSC